MDDSNSSIPMADAIRHCGLFSALTNEWVERLAAEATIRRYPAGQQIFRQGEDCPGLFCVGAGLVKVFKVAPNGKEHILHLSGPGHTFAEVAALGSFALPAHAAAVEDSVCVLIPTHRLRHLLDENHALCLQLLSGMSRWMHHFVGLLEDIVLRDATGRVARYVLRSAGAEGVEFELPVLKKDIASHLNLTSETLSRSLRRLSEAGVIELGEGQRLRVLDRRALAAMTGEIGLK